MNMTESTETRVAHLEASLDEMRVDIQNLTRTVEDMGRVNWTALGTMSTVIIAAVAGIGALTIGPMQESQKDISESMKWISDRQYIHTSDGHPHRVEEQVSAVESDLQQTDDEILMLRARVRELENK